MSETLLKQPTLQREVRGPTHASRSVWVLAYGESSGDWEGDISVQIRTNGLLDETEFRVFLHVHGDEDEILNRAEYHRLVDEYKEMGEELPVGYLVCDRTYDRYVGDARRRWDALKFVVRMGITD